MLDYKLKISLPRAYYTSDITLDFFHLRDFKVISLKAPVLLAFSQFLLQILAKYRSPPRVFVHGFAISSIVESSLVTSVSNHDGRIMPSNHVQQNSGLHTTLKPAVKKLTLSSKLFTNQVMLLMLCWLICCRGQICH